LESAIVGTTFAEKVNDKAVMRHAYSLRGAAESNCGNPVLGATYLTHALDIAKDLDEREATSACIVNLLHTLIAQNRYREAITLGAKAESAFGDVSAEMRSLIRSNLGIAYARNGRLREALITGQKSIDELPNALTSVDIHRNGAVLAVYIRTLIDVENLAQAERRMPQLLDIAAKSSSLHLSLVIEATRALYLAMCGEVEASSAAINDALESATSDYEARRQILELAVKVHSRNGNMEAAFAADIELHNLTSASLSANLKFHVAKERTTKDKVARAVKMMGDVCVATEITEDPSGLHPHRVAELSRRIALRMGMGSDEAALIASAAHLHDLGKCAVPYSIFMNQGVLSDAERSALREHTQIGIWMIEEICPEMPQIYRDVIAFHHEWWNGTGYPGQRGNTEIPVAARITGIADCFDALTHSRPWRNPVTTGKALQQIARLSSLQFDPAVYQALHDEISEFEDNQLWIDSELSWNSNACEVTKARAKVRDFLRTL
jgi:putative two-component system response regulator